MDWQAWHEPYADPGSPLSRRLAIIRRHIESWLDDVATERPIVLSVCAGDGRDLLQVLAQRKDSDRVSGVLIELDDDLCARAQEAIAEIDLRAIQVRCADAGDPASYTDAVPADLIILAGVFGNISDADVRGLVRLLPAMCRPGARVIWTRHRNAPDLTVAIREWLAEEFFRERSFTAPSDALFSVGVHDYVGPSVPWDPPTSLFTFTR